MPMPLKLEIHDHAFHAVSGQASMQDVLHFYRDLLGMAADSGRADFPGVLGYWINIGGHGQVHIISLRFQWDRARSQRRHTLPLALRADPDTRGERK